jgi:hypothetical protein
MVAPLNHAGVAHAGAQGLPAGAGCGALLSH